MANLLPPNATQLERNLAAVNAALGELATPLRDLLNPTTCPARLLPWLAYATSVDLWNDTWTEEQQRAVIASSYLVHSRKGTLSAILAALEALGVTADVIEWWQTTPKGAPYTFVVDVDTEPAGMRAAFLASIEQQIAAVKPVRSHFKVRLTAAARPEVHVGLACHDTVITTIYPKTP